ncbi:MAG: esterase family protein [Saprospiraceae bacterium]|nr:esterase family protein [Saprospiraceae bacterium]
MSYKNALCTGLFALLICSTSAQTIKADTMKALVNSGSLIRLPNFPSTHVENRTIDLWLPDHFNSNEPHNVLYMHDGQMLFDSSSTWNHQSWDVHKTIQSLIDQGKIGQLVVVGIWNSNTHRHEEYFPEEVWYRIDQSKKDSLLSKMQLLLPGFRTFAPSSDDYLKFVTQEVMPYLQKNFGLTSMKENTYIAGSSMGGLISWYALCKYPELFGGAACISTHWPGVFPVLLFDSNGGILPDQHTLNPVPPALIRWMIDHLPTSGGHKLYFDCGDQTLDALYPVWQHQVDAALTKRAFDTRNWKTAYYPGTDHSEKAWKERFDQIVLFLCGIK